MFERIYNDFLLAENRLQRVLIQWKLLQPRFAAKKTAVLTSETRAFLILSLEQQYKSVKEALRKVYELNHCWHTYKKISVCFNVQFYNKASIKVANSLEPQGVKVQNQIKVVLLELQNSSTTPISFNDLPYEFQKRLIALFPVKDVTQFKPSGNVAFEAVRKHRPNFVNSLYIVQHKIDVKEILDSQKNPETSDTIAITEMDFLALNITSCHIGSKLIVHLSSPEAYYKAKDVISGDYKVIKIYGYEILWQQAFNLIYKSPHVKCALFEFGQIAKDQFCNFFYDIVLLLKTRDIELLSFLHWKYFAFVEELRDWLDNLDSNFGFLVHLSDDGNQIIVSKFLAPMAQFMPKRILEQAWLI